CGSFFFQAEDGIRDPLVTGVQTCALPIFPVSAQAPYYGQPYGGSYRSMGGGFGRPGLSPYLNMLRGGSPAANYYLGVVPEFERQIGRASCRERVWRAAGEGHGRTQSRDTW